MKASDSREFDWRTRLAVAALAPVLVGVGYALLPLQSWDYWWHLAMGRQFDATGRVPRSALFLYTMEADAPSIVQPWLAQWLLYRLHEVFGLRANLLLRNVVIAGSFGAVGWVVSGRRVCAPAPAAVLIAVGAFIAFPVLDVRTNLFVLPLFVGALVLMDRVARGETSPWWLTSVPVVAAIWGNLHGSFALPSVIAVLYGAAALLWTERDETATPSVGVWGVTAVVAALAPALHPRGFDVWRYVYRIATDPAVQQSVTEWSSTTPWFPTGAGLVFYVVWGGGSVLLWFRRERVEPARAFLFTAFGILAALQARSLVWFGLVAPLSVAEVAAETAEKGEGQGASGRWWCGALAIAALVGTLALQPVWPWWRTVAVSAATVPVRTESPYRGSVPRETPVASLDTLHSQSPPARIFHDERWGGFLLFHLLEEKPRRIVFVDQRVELPPVSVWRAYAAASAGREWRATFDRYDIQLALLHADRQRGLVDALRAAAGWRLAERGDESLLFERK